MYVAVRTEIDAHLIAVQTSLVCAVQPAVKVMIRSRVTSRGSSGAATLETGIIRLNWFVCYLG